MDKRPIGIFDSGLGGVSVLRRALHMLPNENFIYYGDNSNAPYGCRSEEEIRTLTLAAGQFLSAQGIKALLIACNTATAAAIDTLQQALPIPVIGTEPAILLADAQPGQGRILMMATVATTRLARYHAQKRLLTQPERVADVPCDAEFVRRIESGLFQPGSYDDILAQTLAPFDGEKVDAIVLGCTHYPFIQKEIERYASTHFQGKPQFYDGGQSAAQALVVTLTQNGLNNPGGCGHVSFLTSADAPAVLPLFEMLLHQPMRFL